MRELIKIARESEKSEEQLEQDRKERAKKLKAVASQDIGNVLEETTEPTNRELARKFNRWYNTIRKASVIIMAKKRNGLDMEDVIRLAQDVNDKAVEILGEVEEE